MGSFYAATLYPKENTEDVKNILEGKNFYLCAKDDGYRLVTEEKMDEQNPAEIKKFTRELSSKTDKSVISYMIHDSDVLYFIIYKNGKEIFVIDNEEEYFNDGEFIRKEKENIPSIFGIDEIRWKTETCMEKFEECTFADDFLLSLLKILKLPDWVCGIGYRYLEEDATLKSALQKDGIEIHKR